MDKAVDFDHCASVVRPSSARLNNVAHIFSRHFGDKFIKDTIDPEKIGYLRTSRGSKDAYQDQFVLDIVQVDEDRRQSLQKCMQLENSIVIAQARAKVTEERELARVRQRVGQKDTKKSRNPADVGGQLDNMNMPSRSYLRDCLDSRLLQEYGLLTPLDIATRSSAIASINKITESESALSRGRKPPSSTSSSRIANDSPQQRSKSANSSTIDNLEINKDDEGNLMSPISSPSEMGNKSHWSPATRLPPLPASDQIRSNPPSGQLSLKKPKRVSDWREHMNEEDRQRNRKELGELHAKVNFMKNARFYMPWEDNGNGTLVEWSRGKPERPLAKTLFAISPIPVKFTMYEVGRVYEMIVEVKNITAAMRTVRVLPPRTKYFSVSLGQFPGEHGLIAPGLACQFAVRFSPDSLGDYSDTIVFETQDRERQHVIPLIAERKRPLLTVPKVWDIGYCLVDGQKTIQWLVRNKGSKARFVLLTEESWPISNFQTATRQGVMVAEPFLVWPDSFELDENAVGCIMIVFMPTQIGTFERRFHIICDNCHMRTLTLRGISEVAGLELLSVDGGTDQWFPGEVHDASAQSVIRFADQHPYTISEKRLTIRNKCHVDLPFSWKTVKPLYLDDVVGGGEDDGVDQEPLLRHRIIDATSPFSVNEHSGIIQADSIYEFTILFAPTEEKKFISSLHLIMRDIPEAVESSSLAVSGNSKSLGNKGIGTAEGILETRQNSLENNTQLQQGKQRTILLTDVPELELEVRGTCQPLQVVLDPPAVVLPGKILLGTPIRKQIKLVNLSSCPVNFLWADDPETEAENGNALIEVQPKYGSVGEVNSSWNQFILDVCITGVKVGPIRANISCHIEHLPEPISLPVEALVKAPELIIESPAVDFGIVKMGERITKSFILRNVAPVPSKWTLHLPEDEPEFMEEMTFSTVSGDLGGLEFVNIEIHFNPKRSRNLISAIEIHSEYGDIKCVQVTAVIQNPQVVLQKSVLNPNNLFWQITSTHEIQLINQSAVATSFSWGEAFGSSSQWTNVKVLPTNGSLAPRARATILLQITPNQLVDVEELFVSCVVEGQKEAVVLMIVGQVNDLKVNLTVAKDSNSNVDNQSLSLSTKEPSFIDFGSSIGLHAVEKRYLFLENPTPVSTNFDIFVDYFHVPKHLENLSPKEVEELSDLPEALLVGRRKKKQTETENVSGAGLLKKTPNLADPRSKPPKLAHYDFCKRLLGERKGAAFHCHPKQGELPPFSKVLIEISAYNDMWGEYLDSFTLQVGYLPPIELHVGMTVIGCPIEFTMTAGRQDQDAIVRFGSHTSGSENRTRPIRLKNKSPFEIRIDWQLFEMQAKDEKLLDLIVGFGDVFPLLDSDGMEVPPTVKNNSNEVVEPAVMLSRIATDSPDSDDLRASQSIEMDTERSELDVALDPLLLSSTLGQPQHRPKLIHLFIRPHDGRELAAVDSSNDDDKGKSAVPFSIHPMQLKIEAESFAYVHVTFHPSYPVSVMPKVLTAYALGFLSIDDERAFVNGKVKRAEHYHVEQLRLDLHATMEEPELHVENDDEDSVEFVMEGSLSELLPPKESLTLVDNLISLPSNSSPVLKTCSGLLRNMKETHLSFQLYCPSPFRLIKPTRRFSNQISPLPTSPDNTVLSIDLKPRDICPLEIGFELNSQLLELLAEAAEWNPQEQQAIYQRKKPGFEKELCISNSLEMTFSNGRSQTQALLAKIAFPSFQLSRNHCDFGTCFISQDREIHLEIKNPTTCDCIWIVEREDVVGDENVIRMEPTRGYLEGSRNALAKNKQLIRVFFSPKTVDNYEVRFKFRGILGEEVWEVLVTGAGSFDGQFHVIYNE